MPSRTKLISSLFLCLAFLPACLQAQAPSPKKLKVGVVLALSGIAAQHGDAIREGVEMAAQDLKNKGWDLDLKFEDDQTNATKTVSAVQSLLASDYKLFIAGTWSYQISAISPIISANPLVNIAASGSSEVNGGPAKNLFSLVAPRKYQFEPLVTWIKEKGFKRVFIITPPGDWGVVHRDVFIKAAKAAGAEVVGDEQLEYNADAQICSSMLLHTRKAKADVILSTTGTIEMANLLKVRTQLHLNSTFLGTDTIWNARELQIIPNSDLANEVYIIALAPNRAFNKEFKVRFGKNPFVYSDRGYDSLMLLAYATEKTDGSPEAISKYLANSADMQGVSGRIAFDENGDVKNGDYRIMKALEE